MNNLLRRTLTGAWLVIFILGGFWLHPVSFLLTGLVLLAGSQAEYCIIVKKSGIRLQVIPAVLTGASLYIISSLVACGLLPARYFLLLIPVMLIIMIIELYRKEQNPFDSLAHTFFSVLYTALPFSLFPFAAFSKSGLESLLSHHQASFSPGLIIGFFLLLWTNDTGAYLTGITFGRHRLMERISPKKTWEGFFGGALLAVIAAWLLSGWLGIIGSGGWIIVALLISITGTYGDLIESMLKRSLGIKDSGSVLPGHGGFLDRFDSTIIAFPMVFLFISLFG